MIPKPSHLGPEHGATFQERSVVAAYHHRPPYPGAVFALLASLIADAPRTVLDIGCGTGDIARPLTPLVDRVDAVDISLPMIEKGRRLPGGDHPHLHWVHAALEDAPLDAPYALITAGESLHWMAWERVFPRFVATLAPRGMLAVIDREWDSVAALRDGMRPLFARYSTNREYRPYDLIEELRVRGLFAERGRRTVAPLPWRPTVDEYIAGRHSQQGCSRERMTLAAADAFDNGIRELLAALCRDGHVAMRDGRLDLTVAATVVWGKPRTPAWAARRDDGANDG